MTKWISPMKDDEIEVADFGGKGHVRVPMLLMDDDGDREGAYETYEKKLTEAWKGPNPNQFQSPASSNRPKDTPGASNNVEASYQSYNQRLEGAWKKSAA